MLTDEKEVAFEEERQALYQETLSVSSTRPLEQLATVHADLSP
jgi:hypothetical protein